MILPRRSERRQSALISSNSISSDNVKLIVHGTTIGLNSIIQRQGSKMALVVSQGTRDVFEIGRMKLPNSYDFTEPRETPWFKKFSF